MIERKGNDPVSLCLCVYTFLGGCLCGRYLLVGISSALAGPFLILSLPNTSTTPATQRKRSMARAVLTAESLRLCQSADFFVFSLIFSSSFYRELLSSFTHFPFLSQRNKSKASKANPIDDAFVDTFLFFFILFYISSAYRRRRFYFCY